MTAMMQTRFGDAVGRVAAGEAALKNRLRLCPLEK